VPPARDVPALASTALGCDLNQSEGRQSDRPGFRDQLSDRQAAGQVSSKDGTKVDLNAPGVFDE
jgi:hypothetical protein